MAGAPPDHRRAESGAPVDHAVEVDAADPLPVVSRHVEEAAAHADAGVVHQHTDGPDAALDGARQALHVVARGDVDRGGLAGRAAFSTFGRHLLGGDAVDVRADHGGAPCREGQCGRPPDAPPGAGHDRYRARDGDARRHPAHCRETE